ncbi:MAG: mechanosensitive ion channel family protein [Acidobacteria bacterium]|nr:mechanosensitive ion channel family protein [Acidobacteriota bacterium]
MASSDTRRKLFRLLGFIAVSALLLVLFPIIEDLLVSSLSSYLGLTIAEDGSISAAATGVNAKMAETSLSIAIAVLNILRVIVWMALIIGVVRLAGFFMAKTVFRGATSGELSSILRSVISIIIYIVAFFIIFQSQFPNVQLAPLFTGSTIIGIVVGLALQDTLGNLFAGLALQADQPFQVGDVIIVGANKPGIVERVSWRGVKIRTFQEKTLVISNAVLGRETIEVAARNNLNARSVFFNTLYVNSPARTIRAVREAVQQVENVSAARVPNVRIRNLGDNGIDWEVKYWLDDYIPHNDTDALIRQRIWYVFQREGIDFAFPTRTLHIARRQHISTGDEIVLDNEEILRNLEILKPLSEDEINRLAHFSSSRVYAPGEAIVAKGQEGGSMFVIMRGRVSIQIPVGGKMINVNELGDGEFFGEMSLLTGEPRTATVLAIEETEVLKVGKEALRPILAENPALVESVYHHIEERKKALRSKEKSAQPEASEPRGRVLASIKNFFGLKH